MTIRAGVSNLSNGSNSSRASGTSSASSISKSSADSLTNHRHHQGCGNNCLGAIPRNSQYAQQQLHHSKRSAHHYSNKARIGELQNRLPPIKEFRSPTRAPMNSPQHVIANPKLRYTI